MRSLTFLAGLVAVSFADSDHLGIKSIRRDPIKDDPSLEVVHLYKGQWPTGIAVSKYGRKFANFPAGLDFSNTNNGLNGAVQVAELTGFDTQKAYPNVSINNPPGGSVDRLSVPARTRGLSNYLLGVQSVVVDQKDTLWILDTGRVQDFQNPQSPLLPSSPGGPKLISVDLKTDQITRNIIFPQDVALPDSYLNDMRFDFVNNFAYITDSSLTGSNGIVVVNLKTGKSFRRLTAKSAPTHPINKTVPFVYGDPLYQSTSLSEIIHPSYISFGSDGIAISPDTKTLYFSAIAGRFLYGVPTAKLRDTSAGADARAQAAIQNLGEKGISDGLETDSNGIVYGGNVEQNGISMFNPKTGYATLFTRDPRINWVDTMSIATDGYLYFNVNQLNYLPSQYKGTGPPFIDRRQKPYVLFRKRLPNGGTKVT